MNYWREFDCMWLPGSIFGPGGSSAAGYRVAMMRLPGKLTTKTGRPMLRGDILEYMPVVRIRRRFEKDMEVEVYLGQDRGWVPHVVVQHADDKIREVMEDEIL